MGCNFSDILLAFLCANLSLKIVDAFSEKNKSHSDRDVLESVSFQLNP